MDGTWRKERKLGRQLQQPVRRHAPSLMSRLGDAELLELYNTVSVLPGDERADPFLEEVFTETSREIARRFAGGR